MNAPRSTFSSRTSWDLTPNPLSDRLKELTEAGSAMLDLTESNPTRCGFAYPEEQILRALADPSGLRYDPDPRGLRSAREAVARAISQRWEGQGGAHGLDDAPVRRAIDPDSIVLSSGTSEAYSWLFKLLCEPGDQVLVPAPSYPLLDFLAHLEDVELMRYPICYDGQWHIDLERIESLCGPRTRALVIIQPNNPTGSFLSVRELGALGTLLARRGVALISDEVFSDYRFDPVAPAVPSVLDQLPAGDPRGGSSGASAAPRPAPGVGPLTSARPSRGASTSARPSRGATLRFALGGLSKSSGLPQMKLAWIVVDALEAEAEAGQAQSEDAEEALQRLETIADMFLSVNTPVQVALPRLLEAGTGVREQILARVRANRSALLELARSASCWSCLDAQAGWYAVLRLPRIHTDDEWCLRFLEREHVYVHPGHYYYFPIDGHIVLSLLPRPDQFLDGIHRIADLVEKEANGHQ